MQRWICHRTTCQKANGRPSSSRRSPTQSAESIICFIFYMSNFSRAIAPLHPSRRVPWPLPLRLPATVHCDPPRIPSPFLCRMTPMILHLRLIRWLAQGTLVPHTSPRLKIRAAKLPITERQTCEPILYFAKLRPVASSARSAKTGYLSGRTLIIASILGFSIARNV